MIHSAIKLKKADKGFILEQSNKTFAFSNIEDVFEHIRIGFLYDLNAIIIPNVEGITLNLHISLDKTMKQ